MTLEAHLARFEARINACADREVALALKGDLAILRVRAELLPDVRRALEILLSDIEALRELEGGRRGRVADAEIAEAMKLHGGIRPAARALGINPSVVSRRWKVLQSNGNSLPASGLCCTVVALVHVGKAEPSRSPQRGGSADSSSTEGEKWLR